MPLSSKDGYHWTGNKNPPKCTATSANKHIEEHSAQIAALQRELERAQGLLNTLSVQCGVDEEGGTLSQIITRIGDEYSRTVDVAVKFKRQSKSAESRLAELVRAADQILGWPASEINSEMYRTIPVQTFQDFAAAVQNARTK
jgi:hypothetical protein